MKRKQFRRCLKCNKLFHSLGSGNRICPLCNSQNETYSRLNIESKSNKSARKSSKTID